MGGVPGGGGGGGLTRQVAGRISINHSAPAGVIRDRIQLALRLQALSCQITSMLHSLLFPPVVADPFPTIASNERGRVGPTYDTSGFGCNLPTRYTANMPADHRPYWRSGGSSRYSVFPQYGQSISNTSPGNLVIISRSSGGSHRLMAMPWSGL